MKDNDREKFEEILLALASVFSHRLADTGITLYFGALADLSLEEFTRAVELAARSCKFFPKPVELRELILGTPVDQGEMAWDCFWQAYLKGGYYNSVVFAEPAIAQTILQVFGSWVSASEQVHTLSAEMIQAKRKQFHSVYNVLKNRNWIATDGYLPGFFETENSATIGSWTHGQLPTAQRVFFIERGGRVIEHALALDQYTARIQASAIQQLALTGGQKQIGSGNDAP